MRLQRNRTRSDSFVGAQPTYASGGKPLPDADMVQVEAARSLIKSEIAAWSEVVKASGARID